MSRNEVVGSTAGAIPGGAVDGSYGTISGVGWWGQGESSPGSSAGMDGSVTKELPYTETESWSTDRRTPLYHGLELDSTEGPRINCVSPARHG